MIKKAISAAAVGTAVYTGLLIKDSKNRYDGDCDYLIILGYKLSNDKPAGQLSERIAAAAQYLNEHPGAKALASGGVTEGNTVSEAQVIKDELIALGTDGGRIFTENESTTTFENFIYSYKKLGELSGKDPADLNICLLTSDCHVHRALMFAKSAGFKNVKSIAVRTYSRRAYSFLREYPLVFDALARCAAYKIKRGNENEKNV